MNNRGAYTATEWQTLQFAPLWVFTAVAAPYQKIDHKEVEALTKEITDAPFFKEPLVSEVLSTLAVGFATIMDEYN
ncbi:MAG: hypothetical protein Q8N53_00050 [Longimicrobiales bacterium]|nr:hypothetical protein [Longimicrobiales bacterium]